MTFAAPPHTAVVSALGMLMSDHRPGPRRYRTIDASLAAARVTLDEATQCAENASTQVLRADAVIRRVRAKVEMSHTPADGGSGSPSPDGDGQAGQAQPSLSRALSILLIDGHEDTRALYHHTLNDAGCCVEEAGDGEDGLAKALARPHDVIVTEVSLNKLDGYALCARLRAYRETERTPLIVVTADGLQTARDRAREVGADAVLVKPCLPEALLAKIERLVGKHRFSSSQ